MNIKIIANPKKSWALELAKSLAPVLSGAGHKIVKRSADATICIGGDGTILYANHRGRIEGTILGIGGDKSYVCQLHNRDWRELLIPTLEGGVQKIMTLDCTIGQKRFIALNDVVVHATHYRVAEMDVTVDGSLTSFEGDGMIASSPLGSAAYAYSAGGEKLKPIERKISLVPICPYKRAFSPRVLHENSKIEIKVGSDCAFITDGIFVRRLKKGETVLVKRGPDMEFFGGVGYEQ
jgi:NAD+ kinase